MKRILIVDDKVENLYLLQSLLQGNSFSVVTAEHGAEALELARKQPPDLIVTDILMPVMDGFTLCREWRKDPLLTSIPFAFYTATYTDAKDEEFALKLGADRFITKPSEPQVILSVIQSLLENPRSATAVHDATGEHDINYLKEYNEVLIRKLEDKAEDLERKNAELRAIDIMKDNLLMNVTHELRTPLIVVRGYAELMKSERSGPVTEQQKKQCGSILENADQLLHMVDNLIFMSESSARRKSIRKVEDFSIGEVLATACDCVTTKALERNLTIDCDPAAIIVHGDRNEVLQAIFNLIDNAVKFTPKGGRISVHAVSSTDAVRVIVEDTGIGIAPEQQQRIFERFFQVDTSTTRQAGGLGLGLSIVREIAQRHAGRIELTSEPGKGSVFTLVLPALESPRP